MNQKKKVAGKEMYNNKNISICGNEITLSFHVKLAILPCMREVTVLIPSPQTRRVVGTLNIMPDDVGILRASVHEL